MKIILVISLVVLVGVAISLSLDSESPSIQPLDTVEEEREQTKKEEDEEEPIITSVRTVDMSNQGLLKVPESVFNSTNTELLDVSHNNLDGSLQAEVRHLQKLKVLDLSHNNFTGVPAEIGQLSELVTLDLSHNPLTGLPHELGNLKKLKTLNLQGTQYSNHDLDIIRKGLPITTEVLVD